MNGNRVYRGVFGPIILITIGGLFALNNFTDWDVWRTWPVLIIVIGLLSLWRRTMGPPPAVPPYVPPQPPYGSYRQTPYMGSTYTQPPADDQKSQGGTV
jgi:hypothetical protein